MREGQGATNTTLVLMNHKLVLTIASVVMYSVSTGWSMSYWMKLPARQTQICRRFSKTLILISAKTGIKKIQLWRKANIHDFRLLYQPGGTWVSVIYQSLLSWFVVHSWRPLSPLFSSSLWFMALISGRTFSLGCGCPAAAFYLGCHKNTNLRGRLHFTAWQVETVENCLWTFSHFGMKYTFYQLLHSLRQRTDK